MEFPQGMVLIVVYRISIILAAVVFAWFGYRLLSEGLTLREGEIQFKVGKFQAKAMKLTSGSIFSLCGLGVVITSLVYPINIRTLDSGTEIIAKAKGTSGPMATGGELTAALRQERIRTDLSEKLTRALPLLEAQAKKTEAAEVALQNIQKYQESIRQEAQRVRATLEAQVKKQEATVRETQELRKQLREVRLALDESRQQVVKLSSSTDFDRVREELRKLRASLDENIKLALSGAVAPYVAWADAAKTYKKGDVIYPFGFHVVGEGTTGRILPAFDPKPMLQKGFVVEDPQLFDTAKKQWELYTEKIGLKPRGTPGEKKVH